METDAGKAAENRQAMSQACRGQQAWKLTARSGAHRPRVCPRKGLNPGTRYSFFRRVVRHYLL